MTVTACLRLCNEEEMLPRLLRILNGIPAVTEVVAVDTGSTDGTVALLQQGLANKNLWWQAVPPGRCDEYDNAALAMATGDWVFWIDADEAPTAALVRLLGSLGDMPTVNAVRTLTAMCYPDWRHHVGRIDDPHCRIWRNGFARLRGECHDTPYDHNGHDLHMAHRPDVLLCWADPAWPAAFFLHGQLLKSRHALAAKGRLWAERGMLEASRLAGLPVDEDSWVRTQERMASETITPLTGDQLDPLERDVP